MYKLTSVIAWIRFTVAFHEINKVTIEKPERVTPIKSQAAVTDDTIENNINTPSVAPIESNIIDSSTKKEFDDDFISSFASNDEEQLEEISDLDEFEKAMESYNKKMETGNPTSINTLEQTETQNAIPPLEDPVPSSTIETTQQQENRKPESISSESTLDILNDIPDTENDYGLDIFSQSDEQTQQHSEDQTLLDDAPIINDQIENYDFKLSEPDITDSVNSNDDLELLNDLQTESFSNQDHIETLEQTNEFDLIESELNEEITEPSPSTSNSFSNDDSSTNVSTPLKTSLSPENDMLDLSSDLETINKELDELVSTQRTKANLSELDTLISEVDLHSTQSKPTTEASSSLKLFIAEGDEEIMDIFIEEAEEIFEILPQRIQAFRNNHLDKEIAKELQRDFHTLKGGSRMASIEPMGDLCHQYEMLFEQICNGSKRADSTFLDMIDDGFTEVKQAIKNINNTKQYRFDQSLIAKVKAI